MRFWRDAFILVGVQSLFMGDWLVLATRKGGFNWQKNNKKAAVDKPPFFI
jgi:hypothetical protein